MASSKKRKKKSGKSSITVRVRKGGIYLCRTFSGRKEADRWERRVEWEIEEGRTFWAAADYYCQEVLVGKGGGGQRRPMVAFWRSEIGNLPVSEVTPKRIAAVVEGKLAEHKPTTVKAYLAVLSGVFKLARRLSWLLTNPVESVSSPVDVARVSRVWVLSESEEKALLDACRANSSPFLYPVVLLALCSGASKEELVGLDWQSVDLSGRRVFFRTQRPDVLRPVEIPEAAVGALREIGGGGWPGPGLCFPSSRCGGPADLRCAWEAALRDSGLVGLLFKDLRETLVARMVNFGYSLDVVADFLGLKSSLSLKRHAKPVLIR